MENNLEYNSPHINRRAKKKLNKQKDYKNERIENLVAAARESMKQLQKIRKYYEFVTDEQLIEYAIYREKAEKERVSYLLKKIKEEEKIAR